MLVQVHVYTTRVLERPCVLVQVHVYTTRVLERPCVLVLLNRYLPNCTNRLYVLVHYSLAFLFFKTVKNVLDVDGDI